MHFARYTTPLGGDFMGNKIPGVDRCADQPRAVLLNPVGIPDPRYSEPPVPTGFNPIGIAHQSPGLSRAAGLPWEPGFYATNPKGVAESSE